MREKAATDPPAPLRKAAARDYQTRLIDGEGGKEEERNKKKDGGGSRTEKKTKEKQKEGPDCAGSEGSGGVKWPIAKIDGEVFFLYRQGKPTNLSLPAEMM